MLIFHDLGANMGSPISCVNKWVRHVAIIWKIQVKTFPKNITRYILIIETALWYSYSVCYLYKMFILCLYTWPGGLMLQWHIFYLFILFVFMGFSWQQYWSVLPFFPPVDHVLPELFTMTHSSWEALHSMAHNFIELCKPLCLDKAVIHEGYLDAGKDLRQTEKKAADDEMVR